MIADLAQARGALPEYDLCIVGTGPAGATVALELADAGLRVALLESGLRRPTPRGDALRQVESEGLLVKDYSRERVLGGASTTWAGLSAPLDPIDVGMRPWIAGSGWPLAHRDLVPLWDAASLRHGFAPLAHFGPGGFDQARGRGETVPPFEGLEEKVFLAADPPQDFGRRLLPACEGPALDLWLDASLLELRSEGHRGRVASARVVARDGREHALSARAFVLAAGGIENARLLLLSTDDCRAGLGNERDQVGRRFMNHPKNYHGRIRLARAVRELPYFFGCLFGGHAGYAGLRLPDAALEQVGLLTSYLRFEPLFPWSDNQGVESFVALVKASAALRGGFRAARQGQLTSLRDYAETGDDSELQNRRRTLGRRLALLGSVALHLPSVARYASSRLRNGRSPPVTTVRLRNFMEMEPRPEQRVLLGQGKDLHGRPLPRVRHAPTTLDRRSMAAVQQALGRALARNGFGRLEQELSPEAQPWPIDQDASHHLGATRMGRDPASSVVDSDLRLHEVENVFIAGGSVFPTSGCANPTFTIVALSIRLARHLRVMLGGRPAVPREVSA